MKLRYFYENRGWYTTAESRKPDLWKTEELLGWDKSRVHPITKYLTATLHSDMASASYCDELLKAIEKIEEGSSDRTAWAGNSFFTNISRNVVEIDHQQFGGESDWPAWTCSLADFKVALIGWKRFLEMPVDLASEVIVELPLCSPTVPPGKSA